MAAGSLLKGEVVEDIMQKLELVWIGTRMPYGNALITKGFPFWLWTFAARWAKLPH